MLDANPAKFDKNRPPVERKIVKTLPNQSLFVMVANTLDVPIKELKNMEEAMLVEKPSNIVSVGKELPSAMKFTKPIPEAVWKI